jgi:hypothetical protein
MLLTVRADAYAALAAPGEALELVKAAALDSPGLYAVHAQPDTWVGLSLGAPPDARPLYVGKAEEGLATRDLRTHFRDSRTGSSTLRRSFAALLRESLKLQAIPRNPAKPERFANYGLSPEHDAALTNWMRSRLRLATWLKEPGTELLAVERELLAHWKPPLNIKDVQTPWTTMLRQHRAVCAAEARQWATRSGST